MASEIRVNQIQNRSGLSTVTFSNSGVIISGITTISDLRTSGNTIVAAGTTAAPSISPSGDSNTGIFFPSADTVAIGEGGTEVLRVDSNGRLGINTTNPTATVDIRNAPQWSSSNYGADLVIGGFRNNAMGLLDSNGGNPWAIANGGGNFLIATMPALGDTTTAPTVRMQIDSSGNLTLNNGNLVMGTAGKGIDFSATADGSGTMTSEILNDYEEGTWTPSLGASSSNPTVTYNFRSGKYRRINNLVWIQFGMNMASRSGGSGEITITGLPFTSTSSGPYQEPANYLGGGVWVTAAIAGQAVMFVVDNTTWIRTRYQNNADTSISIGEVQAGTYMNGQLCYVAV